MPRIKNLAEHHKILLLFSLIIILLRLPSFFEPYWYGDEGVYLTLGQAVRQGLVLYRDIHDNKPPLLYWLAALAENLFWFKFLLLTASLFSLALFYKFCRLVFSESKKASLLALIFFTLFTTLPLLEGNIVNAENFLILFTIAGFLLIIAKNEISSSVAFSTGICFSLAILFKVPAGADFGAVFLFLLFFRPFKIIKKSLLPLLAGLILPIFMVTFYYFLRGAFNEFFTAAFMQNIGYLSSWQTGSHASKALPLGLITRGVFVLVVALGLFLWRRKLTPPFILITLWFTFSLFGATLSGRPYAHYLLEVVPSLSLLLAFLLTKIKLPEKLIIGAALLVLTVSIAFFRFWFYSPFSYYENFLKFAFQQQNKNQYFNHFNPSVNRNYKVSNYLINRTKPSDKIFVWGDEPFIYALTRRLPAGRYAVAYHVIDFSGQNQTANALQAEKPKYIVKTKGETKQFAQIEKILSSRYRLVTNIDGAEIYLLLN